MKLLFSIVTILHFSVSIAQVNLFPFKNYFKLADFGLKGKIRECKYTSEYDSRPFTSSILYFNEQGLLMERLRDWRKDSLARTFFYFDTRDSLLAFIECYGNRETSRQDFLHNERGRHIASFFTQRGETTQTNSLAYDNVGKLVSMIKFSNGKYDGKYEYCYNSENKLSENFVFDDSGYIVRKQLISYFSNGLVSEHLFLGYDDRFYKKLIYFPSGLLDRELFDNGDGETQIYKYRFDEHGNEIEEGKVSVGKLVDVSETEYQYDRFGNWIWRKHFYEFYGKKQCSSSFRELIYY